ncbi:MAG TPA: hypothetical protein V6C95_24155, partial [Coleofasciculaceae cyanobacterium]
MNKPGVWQTNLVALLVIFILPFAIVVYQLIAEIDTKIQFAQQERLGLKYNYPLRQLLEDVIEHRRLVNNYLTGNPELSEKIMAQQSRIQEHINNLDAIDAQINYQFKTTQKWLTVKQKWQFINDYSVTLGRRESFDKHTNLVDAIL